MATTEADIVNMAMRLSGTGAQVGLTEAQIMALSSTMASVGINAEAGGSAMSTVMKKISNAVADGGKDMEGFAKASKMSTTEFAEAWKNDPITALDAFIKGLGESGESGENLNAILADLGIKGIQETDTLLRLAGASDLLSEAVGISSAAWEENSALTEEAAQRYATTESQLNIMKNKLVDLGIAIGSIIIPVLLQVVEAIEPWIAKLGELSESTQKTILVIAGIAAAIGPVLVILGTLFSSLGTIVSAFGAVSTAVAGAGGVIALIANPIGIAVAAIGTIIAAVVLAYNKLDWFRDGVNTIWEKIKEYTTIAFNAIKETITKVVSSAVDFAKGILDKFKVFWDENGKAIMTIVKLYFTGIQKTIELVMGAIKGVFQVVWPIITGIVKTAWELIKTHVQVGIDLVLGIIRTVMKVLQGDWKGAWNTIKETAQNIWKNIQDFFRNVSLVEIGKNMIKGLINGIKSMASAVVNSVKGVVNGAIQGAKKLLDMNSPSKVFIDIGKGTGEGLVDGINAKVKLVANAGKRLASATIQPLDSYSLPTSVTRSSGTNTGNSLSTTGNKGASGNGNEGPIIIKPAPIVLDGRVIGEAVFETVDQTMGSSSRLKNHMRGV